MATHTESATGADRASPPTPREASRSPITDQTISEHDVRVSRRARWWTVLGVGALLVLFAVLSYTAVLGKSATFDEPLHAVAGMVHRYQHDFRINPEDPALFGWWASLPHSADSLLLNSGDAFYEGSAIDMRQQWPFVVATLYSHGAVAADAFLDSSRMMFILLGLMLGALIAYWTYQLGGPWAAIIATGFFCLDPNFLAHSALVKNDVFLSLLMFGLAYTLWRFGQTGGWYWVVAAALTCGMAINVKFSGVLFGPILVLTLLARALVPTTWQIGPIELKSFRARMAAVIAGTFLAAAVAFSVTWAVYGFRYSATVDGQPLSTERIVDLSVFNALRAEKSKNHLPDLTLEESAPQVKQMLRRGELAMPVSVDLWLQAYHVLPEAWLFGFLYTYTTTLIRAAYLMRDIQLTGFWYYFPMTMLFKTPTATLAAMLLAPLAWIASCIWRSTDETVCDVADGGDPHYPEVERSAVRGVNAARVTGWWSPLSVSLAPTLYFVAALTTNLNLGLRHILPVYPFIFVALGVAIAALIRRWAVPTALFGGVLALALVVETAVAYPNYLAFFNTASGGSLGGLRLLGDSNLDWGQDLPALAQWQRQHSDRKLYLCYFGTADPSAYGINYVNLIGGWPFSPTRGLGTEPNSVIALSATNVQGIYLGTALNKAYSDALQGEEPFDVLNGTIYLYNWPLKK